MVDELFDLLASTVAPSGLELVDLEVRPARVRVVVDGPGGAQLDAIAEATRLVSAALDAHDPLPGQRYTLEVSSPGVERPLRSRQQFARAVGETVSVRTVSGDPGARRVTGRLESVDDDGFVLRSDEAQAGSARGDGAAAAPGSLRHFAFDEVERARTVFEWGPAQGDAQPGKSGKRRRHGGRGTDRKKITTP